MDPAPPTLGVPGGTVTFLLADVENAPQLRDKTPDAAPLALARYREVVAEVVARCGGACPDVVDRDDTVLAVFGRAGDAVLAAVDAQASFPSEPWPDDAAPAVRMALHTGDAVLRDDGHDFGGVVDRCARLRAIAHGGQVLLSRTVHDLVVDTLGRDVELHDAGVHRLSDLGRPEHVYVVGHPDLEPAPGPLRSLDVLPNNLPVRLSTFVGRERELAELREAIGRDRLVSLTGSGGCGKTRLALQVAADAVDRFPDGTWWVDLAAVSNPDLIGAALADAVGVRPLPGLSALDAALGYLATRHVLLLLDNCEHLLPACADVAGELLARCADVVVLATSREPLDLAGEVTWRVPSLSLPEEIPYDVVETLTQSDAVRLFIERALRVRPNFRVTNETAPVIAQICCELDGIPLAIELAAARVRVLAPEQIEAGLADRFGLLTGGTRTALPRQQTLRASVDWSYELLDDTERMLLRRLAVFTGSFSLDMVEQICSGEEVARLGVLDLLTSLVDKSLVAVEERGPASRYRLLETTRQYALDRLDDAGEVELLRDRHLAAYVDLARRLEPELTGPGQLEALDVLDVEAPNLDHAIERAATSDAPAALALCADLTTWWDTRGLFAAGEAAFERALDAAKGDDESPDLARVLWGRGQLLSFAGRYEEAAASAAQALELAERLGAQGTAARALDVLGRLQFMASPTTSIDVIERSAQLARAAGDLWCEADAAQIMGYAHIAQEHYELGIEQLEIARELAERMDYRPFTAWHHFGHAWVSYPGGERERCRDLLDRALATATDVGEPVIEGLAVAFLAATDVDRGDPERGLERADACLARMLEVGAGMAVPFLLTAMARAHLALGQLDEARATALPAVETPAFVYVTAWALIVLAEVERLAGSLDEAGERAAAALAAAGQAGSGWLTARAWHTGARIRAAGGDWEGAEPLLHAALDLRVDGGFVLDVPDSLEALAEVAAGLESSEEALRLLAAAARARRELELVRDLPEQHHWTALAADARGRLGDEAAATAWAEGERLEWDKAVAWARRARGSRKRPSAGWASLTPTELEVAAQVTNGLTNPQIGERLLITRGTVKVHLSHIYTKLGLRNRAELAVAYARRTADSSSP